MPNYDENDIEACDTVKKFIIQVVSYLSKALDYMFLKIPETFSHGVI